MGIPSGFYVGPEKPPSPPSPSSRPCKLPTSMAYLDNLYHRHERLLPTCPLKTLKFDKDNVLPCVDLVELSFESNFTQKMDRLYLCGDFLDVSSVNQD